MRTKNRTGQAFAIVTLLALAAGCNLLKKNDAADAGADAAAIAEADAAATPVETPAAAPAADNENDIARFPDETRVENVAATLARAYSVREVPVSGKVVASLAKGAAVTQISQRGAYYLVTFADPKDGKTKMGWLHGDAFSAVAVVDAGAKALTCAAGEIALFADTPFCGKVCATDAECGANMACKGSANKLVNGKAGDAVTVCTVQVVHDAGSPAPIPTPIPTTPAPTHDGGGVVLDGGLGKLFGDGGLSIKPPAPTGDVSTPVLGRCPDSFSLVAKDGKCHRNCSSTNLAVCKKETQFCIKCDSATVCSGDRNLCK